MRAETNTMPDPRLTLRSCLDDLTLLWSWTDALAAEYAIPADTQFAIQLCLEEALSNIIRHGHGEDLGQSITVECLETDPHNLVFTIEDQAPPFDPLASADKPAPVPSSIEDLTAGGRGIQLMRKFAGTLAYERLPGGNRLSIGFTIRN